MSQYKDQCAAMRSALQKVGFKNVNVNTVVSSQGESASHLVLVAASTFKISNLTIIYYN